MFVLWTLSLRGTRKRSLRIPVSRSCSPLVANNLLVLVACCTDALSLSVQVLSSCRNTTEVLDVSRRSIVTQPFCFELVLLLATWRSTGVSSYSEVARIFVITNGCVVPIRQRVANSSTILFHDIYIKVIQYL